MVNKFCKTVLSYSMNHFKSVAVWRKVELGSVAATLIFLLAMWQCVKNSEIVWQNAKNLPSATLYLPHSRVWQVSTDLLILGLVT